MHTVCRHGSVNPVYRGGVILYIYAPFVLILGLLLVGWQFPLKYNKTKLFNSTQCYYRKPVKLLSGKRNGV